MRLHLRTFGHVALVDDDGREDPTLATRPRKLALLAWLLLRPGRRASRDRTIGVFWGERDDERARNSLSDALSHLRRQLGRDAIRAQGNDIVVTDDAPVDVDAIELGAAAAARDHARVVALYTGPFLDGFYIDAAAEFDDWRDRERARFAGLFAKSASIRCVQLADEERWDECRALAERWLDAEPASAEAALSLLRGIAAPKTHAAYAAVISTYDSLVRRLDHAVGIAPDHAVTDFVSDVSRRLHTAQPPDHLPSTTAPTSEPSAPPRGARRRVHRRHLASAIGTVAVVALIAVAAAAAKRTFGSLDRRRVVVTSFLNHTGNAALAPLGAVAADWVSRGVAETNVVDVMDPIVGSDQSAAVDPRTIGRETGAGVIVVGAYVKQGDSLVFDARLVDANTGRVLRAIPPAVAGVAEPLVAVNLIRQRVAGAVAAQMDRVIDGIDGGGGIARGRRQPPTYDAYRAWVEGFDRFQHRAYRAAVPFMLRAAALDSTFVNAKVWAVAALGNAGDYAQCDSILRSIMPMRDQFGLLERGLADMWAAVLRGDMVGQYNAGRDMLAAAPNSEVALYTAGIKAIEVNRPEEAVSLLRRIRVDRSAVLWDIYGTRLPNALHWARRHEAELAEAERRRKRQPTSLRAMEEQARALVALGRITDADRVVDEMLALPADTAQLASSSVYTVAQELIAHDHPIEARNVFRRITAWARTRLASEPSTDAVQSALVRSLYDSGELDAADSLVRTLLISHPKASTYLSVAGLIAARQGDTARAEEFANRLASLDFKYQHGRVAMGRARIAAVLGRRDEAVRFARQARAEGAVINDLHLAPEFHLLRGYAPFEALIRPIG